MAKKKKAKKEKLNVPEGFKCFTKQGGGSLRWPNRIIKPNQNFWIDPDEIPETHLDQIKETAPDSKAVVIGSLSVRATGKEKVDPVEDKFEVVSATDEKGNVLKKGKKWLYNVVGTDGKPMNPMPLLKGEATELLEVLTS